MISLTPPRSNSSAKPKPVERPQTREEVAEARPVYWLRNNEGDGDFRVVGLFTVASPYEVEAGRLMASLIDANQPFHIDAIPTQPSWSHAVAQKPFAILRAMDMYAGERLLFVDVDAWVHRSLPASPEMLDCDFAAHWFQGPQGGTENRNDNHMLSGTMVWNPTDKARALLAEWVEENYRIFHGGGQANLERCLSRIDGLTVHKLPGRWCRVFDKPQFYPKDEPTWIEHTIASRENRAASLGNVDARRQMRVGCLRSVRPPRKVVLPNRGEFGLKICYHAPAVHAIGTPDMVIHEPGEAILYPRAQQTIEISPAKDDMRQGMKERDSVVAESVQNVLLGAYPTTQQIRTNDKCRRVAFRAWAGDLPVTPDVVICPRKRDYGSEKNWPHWQTVAEELTKAGLLVFSAGEKATSCETLGDAASRYNNALVASMAAMQTAKLVVCTDSGLAHLAAMCGAKILMIVDGEDRVAPGYWPVKRERFGDADLKMMPYSWGNPHSVVDEVLKCANLQKLDWCPRS